MRAAYVVAAMQEQHGFRRRQAAKRMKNEHRIILSSSGKLSRSLIGHLVFSTVLTGLPGMLATSAMAETAPNANVNHHAQIPEEYRSTPKTMSPRVSRPNPWSSALLPPLESRPENYAQPQTLALTKQQSNPALLHQGPWGIFNSNTGAASGWGTVGYYAVSRWAEDWSNLRDKKNRIDVMDPLKYIPLNDS